LDINKDFFIRKNVGRVGADLHIQRVHISLLCIPTRSTMALQLPRWWWKSNFKCDI